MAHAASVTADLVPAARAIQDSRHFRLVRLFGPEHGVFADAQDLVEVGDQRDPLTGLPVSSLYGPTRVPTASMLQGIDTLVVDLQDVGARYYTFVYTMLHCLEACAREGIRVVVLDRPNPLGGARIAGNLLRSEFRSFVGMHPLPVRHGMTIGELALLFRRERQLDVDLRVVSMRGWKREMYYEDTGLPWVMPSPNMPTLDTAIVYPGGCLVEGTNLSEGRGTTRPFELVGAPWLDPWKLARRLQHAGLSGARFRPVYFRPTFHKHAGELCGGVQVHVTSRGLFDAWQTYLVLIAAARAQSKQRFAWRQPPYEYEAEKLPFDILCGTDAIRKLIENGRSPWTLRAAWRGECDAFRRRRQDCLLY